MAILKQNERQKEEINAINNKYQNRQKQQSQRKPDQQKYEGNTNGRVNTSNVDGTRAKQTTYNKPRNQQQGNFNRCGYQHSPRSCPAFGKKCAKCKKDNHFAQVCRQRNFVSTIDKKSDDSDDNESYFLGEINKNLENENDWFENIIFEATNKNLN